MTPDAQTARAETPAEMAGRLNRPTGDAEPIVVGDVVFDWNPHARRAAGTVDGYDVELWTDGNTVHGYLRRYGRLLDIELSQEFVDVGGAGRDEIEEHARSVVMTLRASREAA